MAEAEVMTVGTGVLANHLVRYETAQVSVDNNGMLHLTMTRPQDVDDLIYALEKAKEVGLAQQRLGESVQAHADEERAAAIEARRIAMEERRANAGNSQRSGRIGGGRTGTRHRPSRRRSRSS
jgi:hypothetical protein